MMIYKMKVIIFIITLMSGLVNLYADKFCVSKKEILNSIKCYESGENFLFEEKFIKEYADEDVPGFLWKDVDVFLKWNKFVGKKTKQIYKMPVFLRYFEINLLKKYKIFFIGNMTQVSAEVPHYGYCVRKDGNQIFRINRLNPDKDGYYCSNIANLDHSAFNKMIIDEGLNILNEKLALEVGYTYVSVLYYRDVKPMVGLKSCAKEKICFESTKKANAFHVKFRVDRSNNSEAEELNEFELLIKENGTVEVISIKSLKHSRVYYPKDKKDGKL